MKACQRVHAILEGQETDRPALLAPVSNATQESCEKLGFSFEHAHLDADKAAALAAYPLEHLGFDSVMPYFSVVAEAAALGARIDWGDEKTMPSIRSTIIGAQEEILIPKDFLSRKPIQAILAAIRLLKNRYKDQALVIGKVMGPWTLGLHVYGMESFLIDTLMEPAYIQALIDRLSDLTSLFARAQLEAGADMITLADHITADLASPQTYVTFLQAAHQRIIASLPPRSLILHCCGQTTDRMAFFAQAGFPIFHFDSKNSLTDAKREAGSMLLTGSINNVDTLLGGTPEQVTQEANMLIEGGIRLISPECALPLQVKNSQLLALSQAVRTT